MKHIFLCFLILLTGFDLVAVNLPIGSFRISIFIFFGVFSFLFLLNKGRLDLRLLFVFMMLVVSMLVTSFFSSNNLRSFAYVIWLVLSFFLIFLSFKELLVKHYSYSDLVCAVRDTGRIQIVSCFLLSLLGVERPSLLYYEPSYLIIALLPYIYFSLRKFSSRSEHAFSYIDLFLLVVLLKVTMSANLILAMALCLIFIYARINIKAISYFFLFIIAGYYGASWYGENHQDLLARTINKVFASADVVTTVLERSGNRWPRMLIGFDVAAENTLYGIGLGTFSEYSMTYNTLRDYAKGFIWNEPRGFPATNIFIEVLAEAGIFVCFFLMLFLVFLLTRRVNIDSKATSLTDWRLINVIVILLLMIESSILRPYFWFFLAVVASLTSSRFGREKGE